MKLRRREFLSTGAHLVAAVALPWRVRAASANPTFAADPFSLGVASGYPTDDGVVLWTRLAPSPHEPGGGLPPAPVPVQWEIATDPGMRGIVRRGTEIAEPDWAFSVHAEVRGLEPRREYWYRFTAGDAASPVGRTRTAPREGDRPASLRLAVASCQQYEHGYYAAYRHMLDDELDYVVHVGDYIYELSWGEQRVRSHEVEHEIRTLDEYRSRFAHYRRDPDLAAAHAACPWLVTWDDHEVDNDYAAGFSELKEDPRTFAARRAAAYRAYYEHMPLPKHARPRGTRLDLYSSSRFGTLATLVTLDERQYRSPQACPREGRGGSNRVSDCRELHDPQRTMLGAEQEQWLRRTLGASRARWHLIAQGVVMSHIDEDPGEGRRYWTDAWNGYPAARERLIGFLAERRIDNPVVLSGDIHTFIAGVIHRTPDRLESPAVATEFVTSSISSKGVPEKLVQSIRAANPNIALADSTHRGYVRLEANADRLRADLVGIEDVSRRESGRRTIASFVVEAGRAALVPA